MTRTQFNDKDYSLRENYYALYLSIIKKKSSKKALQAMGIFPADELEGVKRK